MFPCLFADSRADRRTEAAHLSSRQTSHNPRNLHCPRYIVSPWLLAPGSPRKPSAFPSFPAPAPWILGQVTGTQSQLSARDRGAQARLRRHWACSEAPAGAGLLRRRWHSAAGGRATAAGASAPGVGVAGSFPPTPPSSRAAAEAGAGAASGGQPAPRPAERCPEPGAPSGAVPTEESRRLGRVPRCGTARARAGLHGRAGAQGAGMGGRGQARPGGMLLQ